VEQNRLLRGLGPEDMRWVGEFLQKASLKQGHRLIEEGLPNGRLFLLDSGVVRLSRKLAHAQPGFVTKLDAGAFFGEISVLDNLAALDEALALTPVNVRFIEQSRLFELLGTDCRAAQQLMRNILGVLLERQRVLEETFTAYAGKVSLMRDYTAD
jgi:CRP/FNR family transcriptional regulator, cyclic AMP receptor protein